MNYNTPLYLTYSLYSLTQLYKILMSMSMLFTEYCAAHLARQLDSQDHNHENPSCQASSYPPRVVQPISVLGGTTGSYGHEASMETTHPERTMAALEDVSTDAVITSVISELERISSLKQEQRIAVKAFIDGKDVFTLLSVGFGFSSVS